MDPLSEKFFGVYDEMHWVEVRDALRRAMGIQKFPERDLQALVTINEFSAWLEDLFKKDIKTYRGVIDGLTGDKPLTKGKLASSVLALLKVAPEIKDKKN
ncbi:MAG: hypothetical protein AB7C92_08080, partial [Synergistaceae bacterium]